MTLFHYKVFKERSVTENEHERMPLSVDPCMVTSQNYLVFVVIWCILWIMDTLNRVVGPEKG